MTGTLPIPAIGQPNATEDQDIHDALNTLNGLLTSANKLDGAQMDPVVTTGTFTPAATLVSNVDSATPVEANYMRVGPMVVVSGMVTVDVTGVGVWEIDLTLPVASDLTELSDAAGTALRNGGVGQARIEATPSDNRVSLEGETGVSTAENYSYIYMYEVK